MEEAVVLVVLVQVWVVSHRDSRGRGRSRRIWVVPASDSGSMLLLLRGELPAVSSQPPSYLPPLLLLQLLSALGQRGVLSSYRLSVRGLRGVGLCSVRGYGGWLLYLCLLIFRL